MSDVDVDWDEIAEDVIAIVTNAYGAAPSHYKMVNGALCAQAYGDRGFSKCLIKNLGELKLVYANECLIRPDKPAWTIYNNTLPTSSLSDEQLGKIVKKANGSREGVEVLDCTGAWTKVYCPTFSSEKIYRIKTPVKTERELFIEAAGRFIYLGDVGKMFDAGFRAPKRGWVMNK